MRIIMRRPFSFCVPAAPACRPRIENVSSQLYSTKQKTPTHWTCMRIIMQRQRPFFFSATSCTSLQAAHCQQSAVQNKTKDTLAKPVHAHHHAQAYLFTIWIRLQQQAWHTRFAGAAAIFSDSYHRHVYSNEQHSTYAVSCVCQF
jgi:hypothetical protein